MQRCGCSAQRIAKSKLTHLQALPLSHLPDLSPALLIDLAPSNLSSDIAQHNCRQPACSTCGDHATIPASNLASYDYRAFTGQPFNDAAPPSISILPAAQRLNVQDLASRIQTSPSWLSTHIPNQQLASVPDPPPPDAGASNHSMVETNRQIGSQQAATAGLPPGGQSRRNSHLASQPVGGVHSAARPLLLDVRPKEQFAAAHLPGFVNVPYQGPHKPLPASLLELCHSHQSATQTGSDPSALASSSSIEPDSDMPRKPKLSPGGVQPAQPEAAHEILVVCRRGNDSQEVVQQLRSLGITRAMDIVGGLTAWSHSVDPSFPVY